MSVKKRVWIIAGVVLILGFALVGWICYRVGVATSRKGSEIASSENFEEVSKPEKPTESGAPTEAKEPAESKNSIESEETMDSKETRPVGGQEGEQTQEENGIGENEAKIVALQHAGFEESDTSHMSCYMDYEDGQPDHYEVTFWVDNTEYEYEIDYYSGRILKSDMDASASSRQSLDAQDSYIGEEVAWAVVVEHASVSESEMQKKECKLDLEDGKWIYEMEFEVGQREYEYEVDAYSGQILKAEID